MGLFKRNKFNEVHGGEIIAINDKNTKGHNSIICKPTKKDRKSEKVKHIPITHSPKTQRQKNIKLQTNPQKDKTENSYIRPKIQKTKPDKLGKKRTDMSIKNATDKSVVRHIKKIDKKRK